MTTTDDAIDQARFDAAAARMATAADQVRTEYFARFKALADRGDEAAFAPELGFGSFRDGWTETSVPITSAKYAYKAKVIAARFRGYLPHFAGVRSVFDIGAGPGYLMAVLRDVLAVSVAGCDIPMTDDNIYRALRRAMGVDDLVVPFAVEARRPIPIPDGTDAVTCFGPVFMANWVLADHEWFLAFLGDRGVRRLYWQFNNEGYTDNEAVKALYQRIGAFPTEDWRFCVVPLR